MRYRGEKFWAWADPTLHHRCHDEILDDGTTIDVQVRLSRTGDTQLFIGVYALGGTLLMEEAYYSRPHQSMSRALAWGVGRARSFVSNPVPVQSIQSA
ncbi:hypothetical protein [Pseudomonas alkylphenolica]|uniref:Uncharacterized protein n=1 Tax=Pseudomonas alkylphenolica TaxID=237609 RepID=A0A077FCP7_9PSED|nr:hypothetical protein [Pseudomonas alkylphenolica]AIL61106.1 hypothetical protein PSAKL28_18820 [Pseudomonas alkylphenolica]